MKLEFKVDTKHRKDWFTGVSFSHPAKMSLPLQLWIIENYTKAGETILDPMAGSGTVLVACSLGRNVIAVELEQKFIDIMKGNWERIKQRGAQLGYTFGQAQILQGDARNLEGLLVDKCVFSPPYAETLMADSDKGKARVERLRKAGHDDIADRIEKAHNWHQHEADYNANNSDNIANLPYGQIDVEIFSPPYEGSLETSSRHTKGGIPSRDKKLGQTGTYATLDNEAKARVSSGFQSEEALKILRGSPRGYSASEENIGNLKSQSYLEAMLQVYQQCYAVLKPQGLMILVTKNFIRNKQIVRLDLDTIRLCEQAGFSFIERHYRKLSSMSFWRTIYYSKYPSVERIDCEDILVFVKPNS